MTRLKIYVAGPYTAPDDAAVEANVRKAIDAGIAILKRGHYPFIPHLTHFVDKRSAEVKAGLRWEDYLVWDRAWLEDCDALLFLGHSTGADLELRWAEEAGKTVFRTLSEIPSLEQEAFASAVVDTK